MLSIDYVDESHEQIEFDDIGLPGSYQLYQVYFFSIALSRSLLINVLAISERAKPKPSTRGGKRDPDDSGWFLLPER